MGLARIQIRRRRTPWTDRLRAYKVNIDGEEVGTIQHGDEKMFEVQPGRHEIQLAIDWGRSQPVRLELADGDEAHCSATAATHSSRSFDHRGTKPLHRAGHRR